MQNYFVQVMNKWYLNRFGYLPMWYGKIPENPDRHRARCESLSRVIDSVRGK
jgi:hypothetical protein